MTLNRSRPWSRKSLEGVLWLMVAGLVERTPLAIVVFRNGQLQVVRFYSAFRDFKHGKELPLRAREQELEHAMEAILDD